MADLLEGSDHEDSETCWCGPEVLQVCPESQGPGEECGPGCWACEGRGLVAPYDEEAPVLVSHRGPPSGGA